MEDKLWRRRATTEAFSERRRILTQSKTPTQDQIADSHSRLRTVQPGGRYAIIAAAPHRFKLSARAANSNQEDAKAMATELKRTATSLERFEELLGSEASNLLEH